MRRPVDPRREPVPVCDAEPVEDAVSGSGQSASDLPRR